MNAESLANLHSWQRYYSVLEPWLKKPQVRAYTFLILSIFTSAFFLFFAVRPTINTIINLRRQIADSENVDRQLTQKINALSQIQAQYEVIKTDLPLLSQVLPARADVSGLVQEMEKVALNNQVALSAMQFGEANLVGEGLTKSDQNAIPVAFQITTAGDYARLLALLQSLNTSARLVSVDSINISAGTASLSATIRLKAYYYINRPGNK